MANRCGDDGCCDPAPCGSLGTSGGDSSETHRVTQVDSPLKDVLAILERDLIGGPRQTLVDGSLQGSTAFDLTVDDSDNVGEDCDTVLAQEAGRWIGCSWFSRSPGGSVVDELEHDGDAIPAQWRADEDFLSQAGSVVEEESSQRKLWRS